MIKEDDSILHFSFDFRDFPSGVRCATIFNGAEESVHVRGDVISDYLDATAGIGITERNSQTFRNALKVHPDASSVWWYHMVSCRDNTQDLAFDDMVLVYTVNRVYESSDFNDIVFHRLPQKLADVFASKWPEANYFNIGKEDNILKILIKGIASRLKYLWLSSRKILLTRKFRKDINNPLEILYFGFWDWSVKQDAEGNLVDKYYKKLPSNLRDRGISRQGWLVLFDPHSEPSSKGRSMKDAIPETCKYNEIFFLQSYMSLVDLFKEVIRIKPLLIYLSYKKKIHSELNINGFDLYPLFRQELLYRFLDSSIPHLRLIELATKRACLGLAPKITINFLETYPFSRACYAGVQEYNCDIKNIAMQHASRNDESLFFRMHPKKEYSIGDDGESVPKADYIFAMGKLGSRLVAESGYPDEKNILTGSPRFDHVVREERKSKIEYDDICILFAASGVIEIEIPAFLLSARVIKNMPGVKLILREHFFWKISDRKEVTDLLDGIEISICSLDEDLERADLVLFTTTTLAEEALMKSIPVWQIASVKSNFSSLRKIPQVKKIYSEKQLTDELLLALESEFSGRFSEKFIDSIEQQCFYKCDGLASTRVADQIITILNK